jgi:hypothetical protein
LRLVAAALAAKQHYKARMEHLAALAGYWPYLAAAAAAEQTQRAPP